jgi:hypothetical protein
VDDLMNPALPGYLLDPTLSAFAARQGLGASAFLADGAMCLIFDGRYRVWFRAMPGGQIVMESVLMDLTQIPPVAAQDVMVRLLRCASTTARMYAAGLALDAESDRLLLQAVIHSPDSVASFEGELAEFLNVLKFWRDVCAQEGKPLTGLRG